MGEYIQVLTTTGNKEDAVKIARTLVQKKLAACIQVGGPITSIYRWEERIQEDEEWRIVIKTRRDMYESLEKAIKENHPYEVPEIIGMPLTLGSGGYLEWMDEELALIN